MPRWYYTSLTSSFTPTELANSFITDSTLTGNVFQLNTTKGGTASTIARAETSNSSSWEVLLGRWVSTPFLQGGNWPAVASGTNAVQTVMGVQESSTSANMVLTQTWAIARPDGTLRPNTSGADRIGSWFDSTEWPTTATGRSNIGTSATGVNGCEAGDRLVIEICYLAQNTSTTSFTGTINYGGTGTTDLTAGSTAVTTRPGWAEWLGASVDNFWVAPPRRGLFLPF